MALLIAHNEYMRIFAANNNALLPIDEMSAGVKRGELSSVFLNRSRIRRKAIPQLGNYMTDPLKRQRYKFKRGVSLPKTTNAKVKKGSACCFDKKQPLTLDPIFQSWIISSQNLKRIVEYEE